MTSEEVKDGVELSGDTSASSITVVRTSSLDVNTRAATERAAAQSGALSAPPGLQGLQRLLPVVQAEITCPYSSITLPYRAITQGYQISQ